MLHLIDTLYHGTAEKFETIDVLKGRNNKDFGKGFYMATTMGKQEIADKLILERNEIEWN